MGHSGIYERVSRRRCVIVNYSHEKITSNSCMSYVNLFRMQHVSTFSYLLIFFTISEAHWPMSSPKPSWTSAKSQQFVVRYNKVYNTRLASSFCFSCRVINSPWATHEKKNIYKFDLTFCLLVHFSGFACNKFSPSQRNHPQGYQIGQCSTGSRWSG